MRNKRLRTLLRVQRRKRRIATPALKINSRKYLDARVGIERFRWTSSFSPQKSGRCVAILVLSPKKPNSAKRKAVRVRTSSRSFVTCYIPGISEGHGLQRESKVLVRGGRAQDLPGVRYKILRGRLDCAPVLARRTGRSKYGVKRDVRRMAVRGT